MFPALFLQSAISHVRIGINAAFFITDANIDWNAEAAQWPTHVAQQSDPGLWSGQHSNVAVAGYMGIHGGPSGWSMHGFTNPLAFASYTMQELHERLGHVGQAKIFDYLKTVTDVTL